MLRNLSETWRENDVKLESKNRNVVLVNCDWLESPKDLAGMKETIIRRRNADAREHDDKHSSTTKQHNQSEIASSTLYLSFTFDIFPRFFVRGDKERFPKAHALSAHSVEE